LEYDEKDKATSAIAKFLKAQDSFSEWLWADTLHSGQEAWSLKRMVALLRDDAKFDIDGMVTKLDSLIKEKEAVLKELKAFRKSQKG
jgi:NAD-dependent DNA ligase